MSKSFEFYKGNGKTITERKEELPDYGLLPGEDSPEHYIADPALADAVNVAVALGQPLLVTGEPGTGKTCLAAGIAHELEMAPLLKFHTKTTSTARDLFYQYDSLRRFQDAQGVKRGRKPIENYITFQALGLAILLAQPPEEVFRLIPKEYRRSKATRSVVLIDEIDKAPRDLPNDILNEVAEMSFTVMETGKSYKADKELRPILVLTSNSEKNLPEAFLRRCIYYHIKFPGEEDLKRIVRKRYPKLDKRGETLLGAAVDFFYDVRGQGLKKKPATAEFLDWWTLLNDLGAEAQELKNRELKNLTAGLSILAKNKADLELLKKRYLPEKKK